MTRLWSGGMSADYRGSEFSCTGSDVVDACNTRTRQGGRSMSTYSRRKFLKVAAATGLVVACAPAASPSASPSGAAPSQVKGLTGTITVSYPDELGVKPKYVDQAAQAVQTKNSGTTVKVDLQKISDDLYYPKLLLALQSGADVPDVFHFGGDSIGELADAGYIEPLDTYVNAWADWSQYPASIKQGATYKGHVWAIPYGMDTRWLYFRRDDLQKAGLAADWMPTKLADVVTAAAAVKSKEANVQPYALYAGAAASDGARDHAFVPLVWAYGGDVVTSDGKWVGNSAAIRKALTYYQTVYTQGLSPKEILTSTKPWTAMRAKLGDGSLALLFEGGWVYGGWASKDQAGTQKNVGYILHPTENGGPSFTIGGLGTCWYITAKSKNKDLAWEFIKTWNNKDTVAKINIEDPHPVARSDSADVPEFKAQQYLVDSTKSLEKAKFLPPDPNLSKITTAIQKATGRVANGDSSPDDAAKQYSADLKQAIGADKVIEQ
ncbi:MAG: extracellular solute-binding protein [Chloroflexi bacterium]|nr:MAG: extracellular solute-binding protein [Chloroflexota bacterium]